MRYINIVLIAILASLQYDLWIGNGGLPSKWHLQNQIKTQRSENQMLKTRNAALTAEVEDLKSGLSAIEERARSELGMIKKGETFIQTIDSKQSE